MTQIGHNERSYRLDLLAEEARKGLANVEKGEEFTIGGWLAYGHALNEGRALFPGDREFGQWLRSSNLEEDIHPADQSAAMWAAANADQFEEARQRGNPRTIRGIHAKWKEIEKEREQAEWEEQQRKMAEDRKAAAQEAAPDDSAEIPPATQAEPDGQPAPSKEDAQNGGDGVGEHQQPVQTQDPEQEKQPDPHAKLRAEFRRLTPEAQEEDWINLRADFAEAQKRIASQRGDIADLKTRIKELTEGDQGRAIGNLQRRLSQSEGRSKEHQANAARLQRQVNAQKTEIAQLRKEVEMQEIPLN